MPVLASAAVPTDALSQQGSAQEWLKRIARPPTASLPPLKEEEADAAASQPMTQPVERLLPHEYALLLL